ncbi:S-formylglutathione hydrolase FrmB [Marivirga sericea]|uniref:S-formylglutathione hydrolase FrmB n=1 Tax=Marivirga sericea TaxID=1028 RepID=A0A1X7I443_9BACT|nr:alpha/beta hydrolase family protein [Marivirga sericea]SMG08743.1 S-formylglutathione hydrolase FrmB [Marivirga sericea]
MVRFSAGLSIVLYCFVCNIELIAQKGVVDSSLKVKSEVLKRQMPYSVYLPDSYDKSYRSYPVLYLLHGMWGDHTDWVNKGEVNRIASNLIERGEIPEMIIIMPDGLTDAFYINNYDGSVKWEDFFYEEFIPTIEDRYRIVKNRSNRAIAGLSMGGYGALYHAISNKDMFKACYALSAAVLETEPKDASSQNSEFNQKNWGPLNEEGLPENYKKHSIQEMIKGMEVYKAPNPYGADGKTSMPAITLDCGDDDFLLKQNTNLTHIMKEKKIPFELRVRDGGHTWEYWRTGLDLGLKFVGESFRN